MSTPSKGLTEDHKAYQANKLRQMRQLTKYAYYDDIFGGDIHDALDAAEQQGREAERTRAERLYEALEKSPHRRDCRINPGGPIMEALGDPEKRPCSCGRDDALAHWRSGRRS